MAEAQHLRCTQRVPRPTDTIDYELPLCIVEMLGPNRPGNDARRN